jgi:hypothetical protein
VVLKNTEQKKIIENMLKPFSKYIEYVLKDNIQNRSYLLKDLSRMINTMIKYVPQPCYEINNVVETLKRVMSLMYGNRFYSNLLK